MIEIITILYVLAKVRDIIKYINNYDYTGD